MALHLYNTLSRRMERVEPLEDDHIRMYTCGPTVWNRAHVGNFRTFLFEDLLRRCLERRFTKVTQVMNLTDVDDRLINNANEHQHSLDAETEPWIKAFFEDLDTLGVRRAAEYPRATQYIEPMVSLIERLRDAGVTYDSDGSIYFRIEKFPGYGSLSGLKAEGLVAGASGRVDADDYDKENVRDFALWKSVGPEDIGWDTRIGRGRPGWHIECSAMSMTLLGEAFDIHCGGVDNIFPHHENEIAQSEAATHQRFARIWCHAAHLHIGGEKMAKRLGNFKFIPDIIAAGVKPSVLRFFLMTGAHYRKTLNWDEDAVFGAQAALDRFVEFRDRLQNLAVANSTSASEAGAIDVIDEAENRWNQALDDDLNLPAALGFVFDAIREVNRRFDAKAPGAAELQRARDFVTSVDDILGVLPLIEREKGGDELSAELVALLAERQSARESKDFSTADRLRDELAAQGVMVEDTPQGQRWKRR